MRGTKQDTETSGSSSCMHYQNDPGHPVTSFPRNPDYLDWAGDQYMYSRESGPRMEALRKMDVLLLPLG